MAVEDVFSEAVQINEILPIDHEARRENPPRVTNVRQLVRSSVEATLDCLSLTEPNAELITIEKVDLPKDLQCAHGGEDVSGMGFGSWHSAESPVNILAAQDKVSYCCSIDLVQTLEKRENANSTITK